MSVVIAGEKVYLDTVSRGLGSVNLTDYAVGESVKHLFIPIVPEKYETCDSSLSVFLEGLKHRLHTLQLELPKEKKDRANSVTVRTKLDHMQRLSDYIAKVDKAIKACTVVPVDPLSGKLPMQFTEEQLKMLVRKFAVLILHAKEPKPEDRAALNGIAVNVLTKVETVKNLTPEFEAAHTKPAGFLKTMISLGRLGEAAFIQTLFQEFLEKTKASTKPFSDALDGSKSAPEQVTQLIGLILAKVKELEKELAEHAKEAADLQAKVETVTKRLSEAPDSAELDALKQQLAACTGQKGKLQIDLDEAKAAQGVAAVAAAEAAAKAEGRIAKLETDLKIASEKIFGLEGDLAQCHVDSNAETEKVAKLKAEIEQLKAQVGGIPARDAALAAKEAELAAAVGAARAASATAAQEKERLEKQLDEERSRVAGLSGELHGLQGALAKAESEAERLKAEGKAAAEGASKTLTGVKGELKAAQDALGPLRQQLHEAEALRTSIQANVERLTRELAECKEASARLRGESEADKREKAALGGRVKSLEAQLAAAKAEAAMKTSEVEAKSRLLTEKEAELAGKGAKISQLEDELANVKRDAAATAEGLRRQIAEMSAASEEQRRALNNSCDERIREAVRRANDAFKFELGKRDAQIREVTNSGSATAAQITQRFQEELAALRAEIEAKNARIAEVERGKREAIAAATAAAEAEKNRLKGIWDAERDALIKQHAAASGESEKKLAAAIAAGERKLQEGVAAAEMKCREALAAADGAAAAKLAAALKGLTDKHAAETAALESEVKRAHDALALIEEKLRALMIEKDAAIKKAVADVTAAKEAEFSGQVQAVKDGDDARIREIKSRKLEEIAAAVEAEKKRVTGEFGAREQRLIAQKDGELAIIKRDAAAALRAAQDAAAAEKARALELAAAEAAAAATAAASGAKASALAKLQDFAARVIAGHATSDDYVGSNNAPLRNIIQKIKSMEPKDICILAYFVNYFMTHLDIPNDMQVRLNAFVGRVPDLFALITALEPSLLLANKIQPATPMRYFIQQDGVSLVATLSTAEVDARQAFAVVRRGGTFLDMRFYPDTANRRMLLYATDGAVPQIRQYKNGIIGPSVEDASQPPTSTPISYDVMFLVFLFATRQYVKKAMIEHPGLCRISAQVLDDAPPPKPKLPTKCVPINIRLMKPTDDMNVIKLHPDHITLLNEDPYCFRIDGAPMQPLYHSKINLSYRDFEKGLDDVVERFCLGINPTPVKIPAGFYQNLENNTIRPIQARGKDSSSVYNLVDYGGIATHLFKCDESKWAKRKAAAAKAAPRVPSASAAPRAPSAAVVQNYVKGRGALGPSVNNGTRVENFEGGVRNTRKKNKKSSKKFTQRKR
jgi:hypothetical protein